MIIFDGHNDTLTNLYEAELGKGRSFFAESAIGHIDLPRAKKGSLSGGFFAVFTRPPADSPERDPMYGITFTDNGYTVAERSEIEQSYAQNYTDSVIRFAYDLETEAQGH